MPLILSYVSVILIGVVTITYAYGIKVGKIKPVLTTWILFAIVTWLSLLSYLFSGTHSITGNIMNITDVVMCTLFLVLIIVKNRSASLKFNNFELFCLFLSLLILIFWLIFREHFIANLCLQIVLTIAYLPTHFHLWKAERTTETLWIWIVNWAATFSGFLAAFIQHNVLGSIYAARALILMGILILLIIRLQYKNRQAAV